MMLIDINITNRLPKMELMNEENTVTTMIGVLTVVSIFFHIMLLRRILKVETYLSVNLVIVSLCLCLGLTKMS